MRSGVITHIAEAAKRKKDERRKKWLGALTRSQLNHLVDDTKRPWILEREEVIKLIVLEWDDNTTDEVLRFCKEAIE